ncbi:hypothetical protein H2198_000861 [Neophaeococcomyces mojaviensis]|uniref:Uncharacterized protein n=1 Tax=Neophaeococcomyces mojaviensis TaxID=3383035 RepID=A0ACC3AIN9_9EURO|nr:hypothetical protein H2198_000861 [Knufia sp. JES_112]
MPRLAWSGKTFSTTITAATVIQIVNTELHTTRLSTIYNKIPAGYTVPTNTNEQGTQTVQVTYSRTGRTLTTAIAFPTKFNFPPQKYEWEGVLPTTDGKGKEICSTAGSPVSVSIDYWTQPSTFTTPTHTYGPDPGGLLFTTYTEEVGKMITPVRSSFLDEVALQTCKAWFPPFPANAHPTARFITETSTSYEGGSTTKSKSTSTQPTSSASQRTTTLSPTPTSGRPATVTLTQTLTSGRSSNLTPTPTTQKVTTASLSTVVTEGLSGMTTLVNTVQVVSVVVSTPAQTFYTDYETPITQSITSTSLETVMTNGPSGPMTSINTVQIISIIVSAPANPGGTATNGMNNNLATPASNAARVSSAANLWMYLVNVLLLLSFPFVVR